MKGQKDISNEAAGTGSGTGTEKPFHDSEKTASGKTPVRIERVEIGGAENDRRSPNERPPGAGGSHEATIAGQVLVWDLDEIEAGKPAADSPADGDEDKGNGAEAAEIPTDSGKPAEAPAFASLDSVPVKSNPAIPVSPLAGKVLTRENREQKNRSGIEKAETAAQASPEKAAGQRASANPENRMKPGPAPETRQPANPVSGKSEESILKNQQAENQQAENQEARKRAAAKRKIAKAAAKEEIHFPLNSPGSQARKSTRARRVLARLFWLLLFLAYAAGVLAYFGVLAKDRFVSRAVFVVTRGGGDAGSASSISLVMGSNPGSQDAYSAIAYIRSVDMLRYLEEQGFDLRSHFSQAGKDFIYRLDPKAPLEDFIDYYQERVEAYYNDVEGIVTLEVEGFEQGFAQRLAAAILKQAEEYLNDSNRKIAQEQMKFVLEDLELSENRLNETRALLLSFQNRNLIIDPQADIEARLALIQEIKKEKVFLQAERIKLIAQSPNSPRILEIAATVEGLDTEIEREGRDLTGDDPEQLNQLLSEFSEINQKLEFALERYRQSLAVAEEIRIQSLQQNRFLSVIEQPFIPEDSIRPQRGYLAASFLILGFMGLQILRLGIKTVLEH